MAKLSKKLNMDSPAQQAPESHKGGPITPGKSPSLQGASGGKGTQKHFKMEGPDLSGGGWGGSKK